MLQNKIICFLFLSFCLTVFFLSAQESYKSDSLELALSLEKDPIKKMDILLDLTDLVLTSDPEKGLYYTKWIIELTNNNDVPEIKLQAYLRMAEIYWSTTNLKSSLEIANKAKNLAYDLDMEKEYAEAILILGKIYTDLGDYEKSSDLNFKGLRIYEKASDKKGRAKALNRIGYDYFEQENYDKALEYYFQSLAIAREIDDPVGIARGLNNVGAVYGNRKEYDKIEIYIREAIEINKKTGMFLWEGINYLNLGVINREQSQYDTSFFYYNMALDIFTQLNNVPKMASCNLGLSKYYEENNLLNKSLEHALIAYNLAREKNLKKIILEASTVLHNIYIRRNDLGNAYTYSRIELQLKDSLDLEYSMTKLSQLEMLYEFEKLNQEKKIRQQRREYTYIIVGTVLFFLMVLLILILVYRQRIRTKNAIISRKQLESELEVRNKELASNVMSLMKKNEVLSEIADNLMNIRQEAVKDETKSAIKKIAGKLQKTTDNEIWHEFELRFKQVHNEFYDKLLDSFPDLSPNELRLCALLRLNLTTKEISELTGQRKETIEIARSRLRKKLGITNTQVNLVTFLSQI